MARDAATPEQKIMLEHIAETWHRLAAESAANNGR
jgi:hypothetical protein